MDNRKDKDGKLLPDDVRLNKYGRILRSTSLDELPTYQYFDRGYEHCGSEAANGKVS